MDTNKIETWLDPDRQDQGAIHPGSPFRRIPDDATPEPSMSRSRLFLCALVLSTGASGTFAQGPPASTSASLQARCTQLVELWDRYSGGKSEGGGSMEMPRKSAVADCAAGRTDAGIRTLEDLLRRNGYTVPPP